MATLKLPTKAELVNPEGKILVFRSTAIEPLNGLMSAVMPTGYKLVQPGGGMATAYGFLEDDHQPKGPAPKGFWIVILKNAAAPEFIDEMRGVFGSFTQAMDFVRAATNDNIMEPHLTTDEANRAEVGFVQLTHNGGSNA